MHICSVGCGPASELIAIEEFRRRHNKNLQYTFKGFDLNEYWNPIQSFIKKQSDSPDSISFHNQDVFDYYRNYDELPNMIILNYMLSDMLKMNFAGFNTCKHNCLYCYANFKNETVLQKSTRHNPDSPLLIGELSDKDIVKERKPVSLVLPKLFD